MGHYNSFLVKVWMEEGDKEIRGYIRHVGTEDNTHFLTWDKMVDFILDHLEWKVNDGIRREVDQFLSELGGDEPE